MAITRKRTVTDGSTGEVVYEDVVQVSVVPDDKFLKFYLSEEAVGLLSGVSAESLRAFLMLVYSYIEFGSNQVALTKGRKIKLCNRLGVKEWMLWKHIKDLCTAGLMSKVATNSYVINDKIVTYGKKNRTKITEKGGADSASRGKEPAGNASPTEE